MVFFTAYAFAAPIPDTGQTTCYDDTGKISPCPSPGQAFYGQDACYSINPMSYTKLDGSGNALPDSATSWVTVRDNVTGLIWENKTGMAGGAANYSDPHNTNNAYTWYDSNPANNGGNAGTPGNGTTTFNSLNSAHFGGYSDWRMPMINELIDIVNYGTYNPSISTAYFPNTQSSWYWSSTTYASYTNGAWFVNFDDGLDTNYDKSSGYYVRAVRGGQ